MSSDLTVLARREVNGQLKVHPAPLRMSWPLGDLVSSDGHRLSAVFTCSLRALTSPAEQKMLAEVFLSGSSFVRGDAVVEHFLPALRSAAAGLCQQRPAGDLVAAGSAAVNDLCNALKAAATKVAFSCGLEVLAPFHVETSSATLEQQRLEAMQRSLAEQRAAGQLEHFQRAAEMLREFHALRESAPQLSAGEVLRQLNPADQGALLATLLLAEGKRAATKDAWAVAGPVLVRVELSAAGAPKASAIPLPTMLGPLRSVQAAPDGAGLLVGARSGVLHVDPQRPEEARAYGDPELASPHGFNRAVMTADRTQIWASHSEGGLVAWAVGNTSAPVAILRPAALDGVAPRSVEVLGDGRLLACGADRLVAIDPAGAAAKAVGGTLPGEAVAALPDGARTFVVLKDGTVQQRDSATLEVTRSERRCSDVGAAALLPWLGSARLLLASEAGPVFCVGPDDDLVTQYLSPHHALRALSATADVIAALSADRQRLVLWNTWQARSPLADVFLAPLARHRAADVAV